VPDPLKKYFLNKNVLLERELGLKFESHCILNEVESRMAIRKLIVRYMKHNNLIDKDFPENNFLPEALQAKKDYKRDLYKKSKETNAQEETENYINK